MNQDIPETYQATQLTEYGKELQIVTLATPKLKNGEVLIKVEAAPVNPSDLLLHAGHYPHEKVLPATTGIEGAGVIVQVHESVNNVNVGDRVAFSTTGQYGTYAQYSVVQSLQVIKLNDDITFEVGASSIVNPITVITMLEETKSKGAQSVVHGAAASALGQMFVQFFQENGINVINIVRREEQEVLLKKLGAKYILNQTNPSFLNDLKTLATELNATVFFDPIGGQFTGQVLQQLPNKSTAYVYGALSGQNSSELSAMDLIFKGKSVTGFWLANEFGKYNPFSDLKAKEHLNNLLKTSLKTEYANQYSLKQINEGISFYQANQTQRKILIRPNAL